MQTSTPGIELLPSHRQAIISHVLACLPEEACGLVGGRVAGSQAQAVTILPVINALHSPVRFRMDPRRQLQAFQTLEEQALELIAIFHSHPTGPAYPSPTDMAEFTYPGVASLILSPDASEPDGWRLRAFAIRGGWFDPGVEPGFLEIPLTQSLT